MKLCLVGELTGGVGVYGLNLIAGLRQIGQDITVVTGSPERSPVSSTIAVKRFTGRARWLPQAWEFAQGLEQLPSGIDLVHFTDARFALFARKGRLPVIGTMNDYFYAQTGWFSGVGTRQLYEDWILRHAYYNVTRTLERPCLSRLDGVICISQAVADVLHEHYSIPPPRLPVVPYGIAYGTCEKRLPPKDHSPNIVLAGGNFQRKGVGVLIRASKQILHAFPGARFTIIGASADQGRMERLCIARGVRESFDFLGQVDYETLYLHYRSASVFTMPSLLEAFGIPYLEAMHCRIPVVASDCPGPSDYLRHRSNCLIAPRGDADALAHNIIAVLNDSNLRDRLVKNGSATAAGFTVEKMVTRTLAAYRELSSVC